MVLGISILGPLPISLLPFPYIFSNFLRLLAWSNGPSPWAPSKRLSKGEDGRPPLSWGFFPYAALSMLTALQRKGLSKRAQLKVSVVEIYLEPWASIFVGCQYRMWCQMWWMRAKKCTEGTGNPSSKLPFFMQRKGKGLISHRSNGFCKMEI